MESEIEQIEKEIRICEAKIRLQKEKNEMELLADGTVEHFIYGFIKIIDNPFLLIISIIAFFVGVWLGGKTGGI